jgi:DNA modification methylase
LTQTGHRNLEGAVGDGIFKDICRRCGAKRKDRQIGLEPTPQEYVEKMRLVFSEIKRVLKKDGTLWLNLGDSYCGTGDKGEWKDPKHTDGRNAQSVAINKKINGLKKKDLVGIPWRVAFALQSDGWYLRQDIIWHKPNPMPESVTDRCTKSHEYIFLLSKEPNYYFDSEAIKEPANFAGKGRGISKNIGLDGITDFGGKKKYDERNKRSVWTVNTRSYKEAHFATFPTELITPCVIAGCPKSGIILDPFGGSGTTGQVAIENGRNAILLELNPEYVKLAEQRIKTTQPPLFVE